MRFTKRLSIVLSESNKYALDSYVPSTVDAAQRYVGGDVGSIPTITTLLFLGLIVILVFLLLINRKSGEPLYNEVLLLELVLRRNQFNFKKINLMTLTYEFESINCGNSVVLT